MKNLYAKLFILTAFILSTTAIAKSPKAVPFFPLRMIGAKADDLPHKRLSDSTSFSNQPNVNSFLLASPCPATPTSLGGTVYRDFNSDGTNGSGEPGLSGVTVSIFACDVNGNSVQVAQTQTDANGQYNFTGLTPGTTYRIEFTNLPSGYSSTYQGGQNGTTVQFSQPGSCSVNAAVNIPSDYCQANPPLVTPCYVNGSITSTSTPSDVMVRWLYNDSGTSTTNKQVLATKSQIGSTWGVAYSRTRKKIYEAAFLKRHVGLPTNGLGNIYVTDPASLTHSVLFTIPNAGTIADDATRGLTTPEAPSTDPTTFSLVGAVGLGDIDISDDEKYLYVTNLNDKKVYVIDLTTTPASLVASVAIPDPGCTGGVARPFALAFRQGKLYAGVTCDASISGSATDLKAYVYVMDPASNSFSASPVLQTNLNYRRTPAWNEPYYASNGQADVIEHSRYWYPWVNTYNRTLMAGVTPPGGSNYDRICHPTPLLSDIEFDVDGSMILGFIDRTSHQLGAYNLTPTGAIEDNISGGDILRATPNGGSWTIENLNYTTSGTPLEFYSGELFGTNHLETAQGGLVLVPGKGEVVTIAMDPVNFFSGGVLKLSNTTGLQTAAGFQLFQGGSAGPQFFGKATGLGDLQALCDPAPLQIGNRIWRDDNRNGIQDPCEPPIGGAVVNLYDATQTTLLASVTTNAAGEYYFSSSVPASGTSTSSVVTTALTYNTSYALQVTSLGSGSAVSSVGLNLTNVSPLTPGESSPTDSGTTLANNDATLQNGLPTILLTTGGPGESNHTYDFGFAPLPASLGDYVFADNNVNGLQDVGDTPLAGVTVTLFINGVASATTVTDANGAYSFTGLTPGTSLSYAVGFTTPAGYTATTSNAPGSTTATDSDAAPSTGLTQSVTLASGENNPTLDAGFIQLASLGDYVFVDVNGNGIQDAGDLPLSGVSVTLLVNGTLVASTLTDANGAYSFTGLTPGVPYSVSFTAPAGYTATSQSTGSNTALDSDGNPATGLTPPLTLSAGENNSTIDMGYYQPASLGDYVFADNNANGIQDAGDTPLTGVTVTLFINGVASATTVTNASGLYSFTGLTPGSSLSYAVGFTTPAGYTATTPNAPGSTTATDSDAAPSTGLTQSVTLASGENNPTLDAGFYQPASLGNYVFEDVNGNGIQDATDKPLPGVTVTLLSGTTVMGTTLTDANGAYSFTGLTPGVPYSVSFTAPAGYTTTTANAGSDDALDSDPIGGITPPVTLTSGEQNTSLDAGFTLLPASLGDYVWLDTNQDGVQDPGEPGVAGVTVVLTDAVSGTVVSTTITDSNGQYLFTNLAPGSYQVTFTAPAGTTFTTADSGNDATDSDVASLTGTSGSTGLYSLSAGQQNLTADAGSVKLASLGDYVFADNNANGLQDVGDTPLTGVTVTLFINGVASATTVTNASGLYSFTGLMPGSSLSYSVGFTTPSGYTATTPNAPGSTTATDSDADPSTGLTQSVTLASGENNPTLDAGFYQPASLGNYVFVDANKNGTQDAGDSPLPGVTVTLLSGTTVMGTVVSDANGAYSFTGLTPGVPYSVSFTTPANYTATTANAGSDDSKDSDPIGGITPPITLTSGEQNTSIDAGFTLLTASLGDYVFEDVNANGVQDAADMPIPGVTVTLLQSGTVVATTVTDANGLYSFTGLTPGVPYSVSFTAPLGYTATTQNTGSDDALDSDGNPATGLTGTYSLTANEYNPTVDMGYYKPASLGNYVFVDANKNGIQDAGDSPLPGVTVTLLSGTTVMGTTVTDVNGAYSFTGLTPGVPYSVSFTTPANYSATTANAGSDDALDSDPVGGLTTPITLTSGENNTSIDAGFALLPASLGDYVWLDINKDGVQDPGEPGVAGVTVVLTDAVSGTVVSTTVTDGQGKYLFTNLAPGSYQVTFTAPAGLTFTSAGNGSPNTNSDVTTITGNLGSTATISLIAGEQNLNIDAGLTEICSTQCVTLTVIRIR